jgi:hypothetical protein
VTELCENVIDSTRKIKPATEKISMRKKKIVEDRVFRYERVEMN